LNPHPCKEEEYQRIYQPLNISSMVQTDISQLSAETAEWRQILRNYRDDFQECKKLLQQNVKQTFTKNQMQDVEHYHNQFHIQLINIHDLKQQIKIHERKIQTELTRSEQVNEKIYEEHEQLLDQFLTLESTLQELRSQFNLFINATNC
jgi:chromosome segregation ATPase